MDYTIPYKNKPYFSSISSWEISVSRSDPVRDFFVHVWPMADEQPDDCFLTPDDAERIGLALIQAATIARAYAARRGSAN